MTSPSRSGRAIAALAILCVVGLVGCGDGPDARAAFRRPAAVAHPVGNPPSAAKEELGRRLFSETALSRSGSMSCATCHVPDHGWTDANPLAVGWAGKSLPVRTPTLLDLPAGVPMGWDGKFKDVDSVAFGPITGKDNMGLTEAEALARIDAVPGYAAGFGEAFGDGEVTRARVEAALGTYIRTIVSPEGPFDRWVEGDEAAIGEPAKRGFALFTGKAGCSGCHAGWSMTDGAFHDVGIGGGPGRGRLFPTSARLAHAWRTPGLRGVARRGPFMHDGSKATLRDVIDHYDKGGTPRPSLDRLMRPLGLAESEKSDLLEFLGTLDGVPVTKADATHPSKDAKS